MKREILFRGKLEYNGKWIYGDLLQYENGDVAIFGEKLSSFGYECTEMSKRDRVIPDTIGQYTGLKDKNGNKIFEGDIVHIKGDGFGGAKVGVDYHRVITFHDGTFCLSLCGCKYDTHTGIYEHNGSLSIENWDVIGNVVDTPELMK